MKPWLSFAILASFAAQAGAQVIRTETQLVLVDVAVTDKKGNYVQDLAAKDFRVWEDGKQQTILSLSRVTGPGPQPSRQHFSTLLFDVASMRGTELAWAQKAAADFVDANAAADHSIAVASFDGGMRVVQTFTIDVRRLKAALNRLDPAGASSSDGLSSAQEAIFARDLLRNMEKLSQNLDSATGRKSILLFTAGFPINSDNSRRLDLATEAANRANVAIYPINVRPAGIASADLAEQQAATQQRVAGVQRRELGGTVLGGARARDDEQAQAQFQGPNASLGALTSLAEGTGGFLVGQPGDTATLNRIGQEQKEFYLIGYAPPEKSLGSCHKLRVSVDRKNTEFRARKEYCNLKRGQLLSGNPVEQALEQRAGNTGTGNIQATMQAPFFYTAANRARTAVVLDIDTSKVNFKRDHGRYLASFNILGLATRADGGIGARFSDTVKLDYDDQKQADAFKQAPYRYTTQFDIAAGEYKLVVVASSSETDYSRAETPLIIDPYQPEQFALSALALSTSFHAAEAGLGGLDEILMDDSKKFVVNGIEASLAGSSVVNRNAQMGFYAEIYEPSLLTPNPAAPVQVGVQIRVLKAETGGLAYDSGLVGASVSQNGGKAAIPILPVVPVKTLEPGRYTLDVEAVDGSGRKARRTLGFELK